VGDKKVAVVHVVLEVGATHVRGGIAGECTPRFVIPTPFHPTPSLPHLSTTTSTGETAMEAMRMNCLEGLRVIFLDYLQIRAKDCSVLVVENMFAPVAFRDQLFNALLNEMQVQAVCFQPDMLMPILATGRVYAMYSSHVCLKMGAVWVCGCGCMDVCGCW
jgi:actin-related protein